MYWQELDAIVGPSNLDQFWNIGQVKAREAAEKFIISNSDTSTKLMDAGCSTGVEGFRLFEKGFPGMYVGIDAHSKALEFAIKNLKGYPASFTLAYLEATKYPLNAFDIVFVKDIIEHMPAYHPVLNEMARITKTWLVLSMWMKMHDSADQIKPGEKGLHHNRYQRSGLYAFMKHLGFAAPTILYSGGEDEVIAFKKK